MQKNLRQFFDEFVDECQYVRRRRPETLRSSQEAFRHFSSMMPEVIFAQDLSQKVMVTFFKRLQIRERQVGKAGIKVGIKDSTIKSYAGRLKMFFDWLMFRQLLIANPLADIRLPTPVYSDHRALTGKEIRIILGAIAQYAPNTFLLRRDMAIIGVLTFCGLRRNELLSLELRDIDIASGMLTIRGETSKSKRTRNIPINLQLKKILIEYIQERKKTACKTPYLFVSNNRDHQLTKHGLKHWVERLSKLSSVKFHIHRLRHTFSTNLGMQNVGIYKIQRLMGHSDLRMTQTYLRSISTEQMREDVNTLSFEDLK